MKFDDINLNDEKGMPQLDIDFGLGAPAAPDDKKSSAFSFGGGWGGGWGFGSGDAPPEEKPAVVADATDSWGFAGKKDKMKKAGGGFDFEFSESGDAAKLDLGSPAQDEPAVVEDTWGAFSTPAATKKGKKGKKGVEVVPEVVEEPMPPPPPPVEEKPAEDDMWGSVGAAKTDKKKKKKGGLIEAIEEPKIEVVPEPEPDMFKDDPPADELDPWAAPMSAKDKKKAKKGAKAGWDEPAVPEEPMVVVVPEPPPAEQESAATDAFDTWGAPAAKKAAKKGKKGAVASSFDWGAPEEVPAIEVPPPPPPPPAEPEPEIMASTWAEPVKKGKKGKKGVEPVVEVPFVPEPEPEPLPTPAVEEPEQDFGASSWAAPTKKGKKGKKGAEPTFDAPAVPEPEPFASPPAAAPAGGDDWFGSWGGKPAGKTAADPMQTNDPYADNGFLEPAAVTEPKLEDEWATGTKKKSSKRDKSKAIVEVIEPTPAAVEVLPESIQDTSTGNDEWSSFGAVGKKAKKGSKLTKDTPAPVSAFDDFAIDVPPPPPALVDIGDTSPPADDGFGFGAVSTGKKSKTSKKGVSKVEETKLSKSKSKDSKEESPDDIVSIEEPFVPEPAFGEPPKEDKKAKGWGSSISTSLWGSSSKTSTKSSKEKKADEEAQRKADEEFKKKTDDELFAAAMDEDPNEIMEIVDEAPPPKKSSSKDKDKDKDAKKKSSSSDKTSKTDTKSSKKSAVKDDPIVAIVDETPAIDPLVDIIDDKPSAGAKADGWSFFGASLKSTKKATAAPEPGKEIGDGAPTNKRSPLTENPKMPEVTFGEDDLMSAASPPSKSAKDTSANKSKSAKTSSTIQDRIKALQGGDIDSSAKKSDRKAAKDAAPPPAPPPEPVVVIPPSPEEKKSSKKTSTKTSSSRKKDPSPPPVDDLPPPPPASPLPGGFPGNDFLDFGPPKDMTPASNKISSSKDKKSATKSSSRKEVKPDPVVVAPARNSGFDDLVDLDDPKLPTPPPERANKDDSKGHKKERPKVVRDQQSSSWGFWAAAPPPKSSSKTDSLSKAGTT